MYTYHVILQILHVSNIYPEVSQYYQQFSRYCFSGMKTVEVESCGFLGNLTIRGEKSEPP